MKLINLKIQNYRSIVDSEDLHIEELQSFVGENNVGKSNILYALQIFLTSGAGGVNQDDFYNAGKPIVITATFSKLTPKERKNLRIYLLGDKLILEKCISLIPDKKSAKLKPQTEYHGYIATPKDWWLSIDKIIEKVGEKPNWETIAKENDIYDYVKNEKGKVNKTSYQEGIKRIIIEREDIEFEEPKLGETQALGLQPVLLNELPNYYILPAITDYSDEISRQASNTNFRRLMGDIADRIIKYDTRFQQIETALKDLKYLLNLPEKGEKREDHQKRLKILDDVEEKLEKIISKLMPTVCGVRIKVTVDEIKNIFSQGVSMEINDGKYTDVLNKGHGLQRCVVFSLLQALIMNQRGELIKAPEGEEKKDLINPSKTFIIAIEEPELYIHPQMQRLIFGVLKDFSENDQVLYSTHSPSFVNIGEYEKIGVVKKESVDIGTKINQCSPKILDAETERKTFQFLTSFGLEQNQMFFAKNVMLVEGEEDIIAIYATGRHLKLFKEFPEELGYYVISAGNKQEMLKFMKLLNAFKIPYVILHELDGNPESEDNKKIKQLLNENKSVELAQRMENSVGHDGHFSNKYSAKKYFENPDNIKDEFKEKVKQLFGK